MLHNNNNDDGNMNSSAMRNKTAEYIVYRKILKQTRWEI